MPPFEAVIDYAAPGPYTGLGNVSRVVLDLIPTDPVEICRPVHSLVIQPTDPEAQGFSAERLSSNDVRPVGDLLETLLALDPAPLAIAREPGKRVVGTCRHFATISCALLRHRGIPARVRCGFATYFQPGQGLDHWITEYWQELEARWVRVDSEIIGQVIVAHPEDLRPGEFLSGGEAWPPSGEARSTPCSSASTGLRRSPRARRSRRCTPLITFTAAGWSYRRR